MQRSTLRNIGVSVKWRFMSLPTGEVHVTHHQLALIEDLEAAGAVVVMAAKCVVDLGHP